MAEEKRLVVCECTPVEDTLFMCSPVKLPQMELESVYIGPTGAYVIAGEDEEVDIGPVRLFLRDLLGTARFEVYQRGKGRYSPESNSFGDTLSEDELWDEIAAVTTSGSVTLWNEEVLEKIVTKVRHEDARNRGYYRDDEGIWYFERNGRFYPTSERDSNLILRLMLYGGIFGIHRFALGKWFSGLVYLLTGGLMGLGWFMDLIQISLGKLKDRKKRVLRKPDPIGIPWYIAGFAVSFALFCAYCLGMSMMTEALSTISQQSVQSIDPEQANKLANIIENFSGN